MVICIGIQRLSNTGNNSQDRTISNTGKTLVIDPANLIPCILEALTGPDSKEIAQLSQLIDANKGTKKDRKRLLSLIDKANKRISN